MTAKSAIGPKGLTGSVRELWRDCLPRDRQWRSSW